MNKYLISAYRNLVKRRLFSLVNVIGLTFGLVCALYIGTYVIYEFSYDTFYKDTSNIYRLNKTSPTKSGQAQTDVILPTALKPHFDEHFDQIAQSARIQRTGPMVFGAGESKVRERNGFYADPELLQILEVPVVQGDGTAALGSAEGILISESLSRKYFPEGSALGESISISPYYNTTSRMELVILGIYKDFPVNTHFKPDFLFSIELLKKRQRKPLAEEWSNSNAFTYVKLMEGVDQASVNALIADLLVKNNTYDMTGHRLYLQPISEIHMQDFVAFGDLPGQIKKSNLYILSGIGVLILLLVCINFFNMSTARSLERAKEIGIRKSVGASRMNVIVQFMIEAALQVTVGLVLSIILFEVSDGVFASITGASFEVGVMISAFGLGQFLIFVGLLWLALVFGSGFYPALVISRFKPVDSLKGNVRLGGRGFNLGRLLLTVQLVITLVISIVAFTIYGQVSFMEKKDPGYDRDAMISLMVFNNNALPLFHEAFEQNPLIERFSFTDDNLLRVFNAASDYSWPGKDKDERIKVFRLSIDDRFLPSMGIELIAGRNFNPDLKTDDQAVLLNESAAKLMGISSMTDFPAITKGSGEYEETLQVIGITKDFQAGTLREEDKPIVMYRNSKRLFRAYIVLNKQQTARGLKSIEDTWNKLMPDQPFEYQNLNEVYESMLSKDRASGKTLLFFTVVSVAISFFGLFGMTSLNVQSRMKELGIRKILGAHFKDIFSAVSKQFRATMLIAILIGIPLAWLIGQRWLDEFTHRIQMGAILPLVVILGMTVIGALTLYSCTLRFIRMNPVDTLRES